MDIFIGEGAQELFDPAFRQFILLEIVGCMGLSSSSSSRKMYQQEQETMDPQCVVKLAKMEIHRTKPVYDTAHPIWTVLTGGLCILDIPTLKSLDAAVPGSPRNTLRGLQRASSVLETGVSLELVDKGTSLGYIALTLDQVRNICDTQPGERLEVDVTPPRHSHHSHKKPAVLSLRLRYATRQDLIFLKKLPPDPEPEPVASSSLPHKDDHREDYTRDWAQQAADLEFHEVRSKSMFKKYTRMDEATQTKQYRVMPFPDPQRPAHETEWMTKQEIQEQALQPSQHFIHAGTGTVGKCFVEIIGANDLPNMDVMTMQANDASDPFVSMVFEDSMVRTDMLWDELSPRWMPWTMRAFCFHIRHPQSLLLLGVFDYDDAPLETHDAIGRIVVNVANFYADTTYLLHYNLQHDPRFTPQDAKRGQIILRLRVEWENEAEMLRLIYTSPPKCIINCKTDKSYQVLRYLKRGPLDMEQASMNSIKVYASEASTYGVRICHFLDIMFEVFLWRGRLKITDKRSIWFPHHSIALSVAVLLCLEYPRLIGPIILYGVAWVLITINLHNSNHPYPWKRVKRFRETNYAVLTGREWKKGVTIGPTSEEQLRQAANRDKLDSWRGQRMSNLISATLDFYNTIYQIYSTTAVTSKFFSTQKGGWSFLESQLTYPHMALKYLCKTARLYLSFINWDGYAANNLVLRCLCLATIWLFLPVNSILLWVARILAWILLGPWVKFLDIYWVHSWYMTSSEMAENIDIGVETLEELGAQLPNFDSILQSGWLADMSFSGRLVAEHASKLKAMRDYRFGKFSEFIPFLDDSRYQSIPLPQSTAEPYKPSSSNADADPKALDDETNFFVPCQKLRGSMIMQQVKHEALEPPPPPPQPVNGTMYDSPPRAPSPTRAAAPSTSTDHLALPSNDALTGSPVRPTLRPSDSMQNVNSSNNVRQRRRRMRESVAFSRRIQVE